MRLRLRLIARLLFVLWCMCSISQSQVQNNNLPDCQFTFSFSVVNSVVTNSRQPISSPTSQGIAGFDNRNVGCSSWHLTYQATSGISALSLEVDQAPDTATLPGTWSVWPSANITAGQSLPMTTATFGNVSVSQFAPWVSALLNSATGTGTVSGRAYGWRAQGNSETSSGAGPVRSTPYQSGFTKDFKVAITALTNAAVAVTTATVEASFYCNNITAGAVTITITDTATNGFVTAFSLGANSNVRFPPGSGYMQMVGIKWNASANASINCLIEGYQ